MGDSKEMMVWMGRLLFLGGVAAGIIGMVAGLADRSWKLGATGWFEGGLLMGVLAIVVMADSFVSSRPHLFAGPGFRTGRWSAGIESRFFLSLAFEQAFRELPLADTEAELTGYRLG